MTHHLIHRQLTSTRDSLLRHSRAHSRSQPKRSRGSVTPSTSSQYSLVGESVQTEITARSDRTLRRDYDAESQNSLSSSSFSKPPTTSVITGWGGQTEQAGQALANGSLQHHGIEPDVGPPSTGQYVGNVFPDVPASIFNTPTDLELLDIGLNAHEPAWLLGSDFDLNALDFPLSTAISEWGHPNPEDVLSHQEVHDSSNALGRSKGHMPLSDLVPAVQYNWYTTLTRDVVCYESPDQLYGQDHIDEAYREGLRCKLQPNPSNTALPSADFLVSSSPSVLFCAALDHLTISRIFVSNYTLSDSTQFFQLYMHRPSALLRRMPSSSCLSALSVLYLWARRPLLLKGGRFSKR